MSKLFEVKHEIYLLRKVDEARGSLSNLAFHLRGLAEKVRANGDVDLDDQLSRAAKHVEQARNDIVRQIKPE